MKSPRSSLLFGVVLVTFLGGNYAFAQESSDENTATACRDLVDNDSDGYVDCDDLDCGLFTFCSEATESTNNQDKTTIVRDGRGLFVAGLILNSVGIVTGGVSLGLATQSTEDDAFLFSSIGVGALGWVLSSVGGGLMLGGQNRDWKTVRQFGGQTKTALFISSAALYGLMAIGGVAVTILGPTVGPATGVGSAPFWGPMLALEVIAFSVLLPAGVIASRSADKAVQGAKGLSLRPYLAKTRENGDLVFGLAGSF